MSRLCRAENAREIGANEIAMFYGWRVLAALCIVYFMSVGVVFYSFAVVLPTMLLDMGWSRGGASVGHAILGLAFGGAAVASAFVLGRIGARNTIAIGGLVSAAGSITIYYTETLAQFYVGIGVIGVGISLQSVVPGTHLLTSWFTRKRAISMGLFMSMGGLGAFVAAPAVAYLMEVTGDWRIAWLVTATCAALGSVAALAMVKNSPSDVGTYPDGIAPGAQADEEAGSNTGSIHQTKAAWSTAEAYRTYAMWVILLTAAMAGIGLALNASQSVIHLLDKGISPVVAGSAVGIVGLLSTGGRLLAGATGDRVDPRFLLGAGLAVEIIGIVLLNFTDTTAMVYAYSILFGLGNGATIVAIPALVANYYGAAGFAKIYGVVHLILTPFAASASVVAGYVYDYTQSYAEIFLGFSVLAAVPVIMIILMRPPRHTSEVEPGPAVEAVAGE